MRLPEVLLPFRLKLQLEPLFHLLPNLVIKKPYQLPTKRVIKKSFPAPPITLFDFIYFSSKI
nr:MAG TPA: hypothetical protein [Caudoviricetes sp.]